MKTIRCVEAQEIPYEAACALQFIGFYVNEKGMDSDGLFYIVGKEASRLRKEKKSLATVYETIDNWLILEGCTRGEHVYICSSIPDIDTYMCKLEI